MLPVPVFQGVKDAFQELVIGRMVLHHVLQGKVDVSPVVGSQKLIQIARCTTLLADAAKLLDNLSVGPAPHDPGGIGGVFDHRFAGGHRSRA